MKTYTAICPKCGAVNENLYLEETDGSFECSRCLSVCHADNKVYDRKRRHSRSAVIATTKGQVSFVPAFAAANV